MSNLADDAELMNLFVYLYIHYLSIYVTLLTVYSNVCLLYLVVWSLNFSLVVLFM